jgi:hypothetical protein
MSRPRAVARALGERRLLVLGLKERLDAGERSSLDLAGARILGLLAGALQHRLGHPATEALAGSERQQ